MKKRFIMGVLVVLLGMPFAHTQTPSRVHRLRRPKVSLENTIQRKAATTQLQLMSPTAFFHRAGNMEFWHAPVVLPTLEQPRLPVSPAKRSRESLEVEATAYHMPDYIPGSLSNEELRDFIFSYRAMKNAQGVPSRFEYDPQADPAERMTALHNWVIKQPDFVEENYIYPSRGYPRWSLAYIDYAVPFHASVKEMRILIVQDAMPGAGELAQVVENHPGVTITWRKDALSALEELNRAQYDIVLADFALGNAIGLDVSMYIWNKKLDIPVICYSVETINREILFAYNIVGRIPIALEVEHAEILLNYLSNIVATGRARPQ
ncbi:MAG: response regulator [Elusimicrobiaceae bacterium]|nr:response regulator [Elusimicrobiaceae bacterium]